MVMVMMMGTSSAASLTTSGSSAVSSAEATSSPFFLRPERGVRLRLGDGVRVLFDGDTERADFIGASS